MKATYPVIFTEIENNVLIEVPDLGIMTEVNEDGKKKGSMADAIMMVRDAIGLHCITLEDNGMALPRASKMNEVNVTQGVFYKEGIGIVSLVDVDLEFYRRLVDNKTVRRNVTLPNWLNQAAEREQINVSKVLQEALMAKLGVYR